ncbi:MAG: Gfo/Idh/MocA family protein [Nitrososphaerales archaeon]
MSESKDVRVGIVGTGIISNVRAKGYLTHKKAKISAVCDLDQNRAREKAKLWGVDKVYTDYRKLLNDETINAVEVLLPHSLHSKVVVDAARAGKNVAVMKPIAVSLTEADAMINAAKDNGVVLSVAENYVNYPPIAKAAQLIRGGEIGDPTIIRMNVATGKGGPPEWVEPDDPKDWRQDKKANGGFIYDAIVHNEATARLLMGYDVHSVSAMFQNMNERDERPGVVAWSHEGLNKFGTLTYAGKKSVIPITTDYYPVHEAFEVVGTKGIIWITRVTGKMLGAAPLIMYKGGEEIRFESLESDYALGFRNSVYDFIDSIVDKREPKFTGADGKKQIQFAWAVYKAANEHREVRLDEIT